MNYTDFQRPQPITIHMKAHPASKIIRLQQLRRLAQRRRRDGRVIVLCHGCFDIVHPGHVRHLQSAGSHGDVLVVSLTSDDAIEKADGTRPYIPQEHRAENLAALQFVDHVIIADSDTAGPIIRALEPDLYVKGREYEHSTDARFLAERRLVEAGGGRVMFSSGDVVFSSTTILDNMAARLTAQGAPLQDARLRASCKRWAVTPQSITRLLDSFKGKRVAVFGDAICDQYVFCETADVADEAPVLTLKPSHEASYLGGAAIIAGHVQALGASAHLFSVVADDEPSRQLLDTLEQMGVTSTTMRARQNLPIKQRFLAQGQKVLKVDRGEPHPLDSDTERKLIAAVEDLSNELDALIIIDFGYGAVTSTLLEALLPKVRQRVAVIAADISGPRRTLLSMKNVDLLTPTERELRGVAGDFEQSLPTVAASMMKQLAVPNLIVTLGDRGAVMFHPRIDHPRKWFDARLRCEYLPAGADHVRDVVGAGDALLAASTLAQACGASLPQAGHLGSAAAAVAVSRLGNLPVSRDQLLGEIQHKPELMNPSLPSIQTTTPADARVPLTAC